MRNYHHFHRLHSFFESDLSKLESFVWVHTFARSLIGIFIPIILYTSGFSLSAIMLYYVLFMALDVLFNFIARFAIQKWGAYPAIIVAVVAEIAYFVLLSREDISTVALGGLALAAAIYDAFFWVGHWFIFNECATAKKAGSQVSALAIVRFTAAYVAPFIGMLLLLALGKSALVWIVIAITILGLIPFMRISSKFMRPKPSKSHSLLRCFTQNKRMFFQWSLFAIHEEVEIVILPLFLFTTFASIRAVGVLPMVTALGTVTFTYYLGKAADKRNPLALIGLGAVCIAALWILRLAFPQVGIFYLSTLFVGLFIVMVFLPLEAGFVRGGKRNGMLEMSMLRNCVYMFVSMLLYLGLYIALEKFSISFLSASVSMFFLAIISGLWLLIARMKKR